MSLITPSTNKSPDVQFRTRLSPETYNFVLAYVKWAKLRSLNEFIEKACEHILANDAEWLKIKNFIGVDMNISLIFGEIREIIPKKLDEAHEWLNSLEQEASNNSPTWVQELKGFAKGLWAANVIDTAELDDIDKILEKHGLL